jgi:hypothetical protein
LRKSMSCFSICNREINNFCFFSLRCIFVF